VDFYKADPDDAADAQRLAETYADGDVGYDG
jgi:hypothetical protein